MSTPLRLAAWTVDETLRLYELTENGFVQVGSSSLEYHTNYVSVGSYPTLAFVRDNNFIYADSRYGILAAHFIHRTFSATDASSIADSSTQSIGSGENPIVAWVPVANLGLTFRKGSNPISSRSGFVNESGGVTGGRGTFASTRSGTHDDAQASPDGTFVACALAAGDSYFYTRDGEHFENLTTIDPTLPRITNLAWSPDSNLLFCLNSTSSNVVYVYRRDGMSFSKVSEIHPEEGHTAHRVTCSPDNRHVVISYIDGNDDYYTKLFIRFGNVFHEVEIINGIGRLLDYNAAGSLLIDAYHKKAFSFDGSTFTEEENLLDNVAGTPEAQAISQIFEVLPSISNIYDNGLSILARNDLSANTKILLLNEDVVFNPTHDSIADVTDNGTHEVFGSGWPEGGKELENINIVDQTSTLSMMVADNVEQIISTNPITFRALLIVDGDTPIMLTRFTEDITVFEERLLIISLEDGIASFTT